LCSRQKIPMTWLDILASGRAVCGRAEQLQRMAQRMPPQGKPPLSAGEMSAARSAAKARAAALPKQPPPQAYLTAALKKPAEQQEEDLSSFSDLSASPRFDECDADCSSSHKPGRRDTFEAADDDDTSVTAVRRDSGRNSPELSRSDSAPEEIEPSEPGCVFWRCASC
jgi:hypothetical protein